jgi:23S rRNA (adenine2503-C2)-methyltransferase
MAIAQITNIVFMGMGEPLYNLDNVDEAIDVISDGDGISISEAPHHRVDRRRRARNPELGAAPAPCWPSRCTPCNDDLRDELVPINKKYPSSKEL